MADGIGGSGGDRDGETPSVRERLLHAIDRGNRGGRHRAVAFGDPPFEARALVGRSSRGLELPPEERVTQPLPEEIGWGPTYEDLARLERGELSNLLFARRYCIEGKIGSGGMATVYGGVDLTSGRPVAVKVLSRARARCEQSLTRFSREGLFGGHVHHPNVVETLDSGATLQGISYVVMERLEGEDLRTLVKRVHGVGLPWPRARSLVLQICEGLAAIHAHGIVHRDVKTSNCFRVGDGPHERVKLLDFGIATHGADAMRDGRLDEPDTISGTPQYMSPEQARGDAVDVRSDVYALGIVLCELVTGRRPFRGRSAAEILGQQIHQSAPPLSLLLIKGKRIDPEVDRIYQRAVSKEPEQRFSSIAEMAQRIRAVDPQPASWTRVVSGLVPAFVSLCRRSTGSVAHRESAA